MNNHTIVIHKADLLGSFYAHLQLLEGSKKVSDIQTILNPPSALQALALCNVTPAKVSKGYEKSGP